MIINHPFFERLTLQKALPPAYRIMALLVAGLQIWMNRSLDAYLPVPLTIVLGIVALYTIIKVYLHFTRVHLSGHGVHIAFDVVLCAVVLFITGGIFSPFLLYTISPVLTVALLLQAKTTFYIGSASIIYVILAHTFNPFTRSSFTAGEISYLLVFIIATVLSGILPYLVNANLRQHIQSESIIRERQRLSRELHDGITQTLAVLHWQTQLIQHQLEEKGVNLKNVSQLEELVTKAQYDARESLQMLHTNGDRGSLVPQISLILDNISKQKNIVTSLNLTGDHFHLSDIVEIELVRICQEALVNIRKHARAKNVQVTIGENEGNLEISISDDGRGFNLTGYLAGELPPSGIGLVVMRERAESIGGDLQVTSEPGLGTTVLIKAPCIENPAGVLWHAK